MPIKKAKRMMVEEIKKDIETKFSDYSDEKINILTATSTDEETTQKWIEQIKEAFPGKDVLACKF